MALPLEKLGTTYDERTEAIVHGVLSGIDQFS